MTQHNMISEQDLRNNTDFIKSIINELPNQKPPKNFTQNVMNRVAQQVPIKKEAWYQSLGLWLILTGIGTVFFGSLGILYYLCDQSVALMFKVILNFIERYEISIPDMSSYFSNLSINSGIILVIVLLGVFALIDTHLSRANKPKKENIYSIL